MIFVPPRFAADSILEAADAGISLIVAITEGIPAHDELRVYNTLKRDYPGTRLVGPNCPGILSPGKANVGIIPAAFFKEGNVGVVSRSGTLTYQIGNEIAQRGFGNSSIVGIGGDPVPGSSFVDIIELFQADDRDRADRAERRDRRLGRGGGRGVHRRERDASRSSATSPASRRRPARDGPRRRDRLRLLGHRRREGRGARGQGRARRPHAHRRSPRSPSRSSAADARTAMRIVPASRAGSASERRAADVR